MISRDYQVREFIPYTMPLRLFLDRLTDREVPRGLPNHRQEYFPQGFNPRAEPRVLRVTK